MIAYLRVSTSAQGESRAGLEAQRTSILAVYPDVTEWFEEVETGSGKRPLPIREAAIARAIETSSGVVAAKLDRLTRSTIDFYTLNERAKKQRFQLVACDIGFDTSTPMGEAMAGMVAVFAQLERRRISERTSEGMQAKKRQGQTFGRPCTIPQHVKDHARALLAANVSPSEIARRLPISRPSVYALRGK